MTKLYLPKNKEQKILSLLEKYNIEQTNLNGYYHAYGTDVFLRKTSSELQIEVNTNDATIEKDILKLKFQ